MLSRELLSNDVNAGQEIQWTIDAVKRYLDWLRPSAQGLRSDLQRQSEELINRRKREEAANVGLLASLGIPIRSEAPMGVSAEPAQPRKNRGSQPSRPKQETKQWDIFISHASEDKEEIARPLADALGDQGLSVWYDEFSLKLGDSLRQAIDKGLTGCSFGVVILSGFEEVRSYSPTLADRFAAQTDMGLSEVVKKVMAAVR